MAAREWAIMGRVIARSHDEQPGTGYILSTGQAQLGLGHQHTYQHTAAQCAVWCMGIVNKLA